MPTKPAQNTKAEPMTYKVEHVSNLSARRTALAQSVAGLSKDELRTQAEAAHIDLSGAGTVAEMSEAVQAQVRGSEL